MTTERLVTAAASALRSKMSRRGFLVRAAIAGSALSAHPVDYLLRPVGAYDSICGPAPGCNDGYSAMCCTINHGVNECPPGSFPGGWWKADYAALCGGSARYIIDCQSECTHCSSGCDPFCEPSCRDCDCHCASGTCDERHVCCNVFRYGQCNQDRACSGAIMCRAITCKPPWEWLSCSSASATDDYTAAQSAPCLPSWDAMQQYYYRVLGGPSSWIGVTVGAAFAVHGGTSQRFTAGQMFDSTATGPHAINYGATLAEYDAAGGTAGYLGFPTSNVESIPNGHQTLFQGGRIYWSASTGAHALNNGATLAKYLSTGGSSGYLGYPVSNVEPIPNGHQTLFQGGRIYWSASTGAHAINNGATLSEYLSIGGSSGYLGYPTSDVEVMTGGHLTTFEGGYIYWSATTGAHAINNGATLAEYLAVGGPAGELGFPTSSVEEVAGGHETMFDHGMIAWFAGLGAHALTGPIHDEWLALHGPTGALGWPTTDAAPTQGVTGQFQVFQNGAIYWSATTAAHAVQNPIEAAYTGAGGPAGRLGFPTSDQYEWLDPQNNQTYPRSDFQGGYAYDDAGVVKIVYT